MIFGVQIIGIFFAVVMLYLTFLYYKKNHYSISSFILWTIVWIGFLILVLFPQTIYGIMQSLEIERTVDFFVIAGFLFFSLIIFYLYNITKQTQQKVEKLVRKIAIEERHSKENQK